MTPGWAIVDDILDAAAELVIGSGLDGITMAHIAERSGATIDEITTVFPHAEDVLVSMLNREFRVAYTGAIAAIEDDPRGGMLSRLWRHNLTALYESPIARQLQRTGPVAMASLMNHSHGFRYAPTPEERRGLIEMLQDAGLVRRDINAAELSWTLTAFNAGLTTASSPAQIELAVRGLSELLQSAVDTDATDVDAGRRAYYAFVTKLAL